MTLRWLICFSASLLPLCGAAVSGRVELRDSRYAAVRNHHDYSGVVIALTPAESTAPPVAGNEVCRLRDIVSAACEVFSPTAEAQSVNS
jgi:hypothetical protein